MPSGTVTLLFSDIEASTQLWERSSSAMSEALRRHDEIVRSAIEGEGGYVFKTVGDAFCAAFATGDAAARAAGVIQQGVRTEKWPADAVIRLRLALHSGVCEERDGDYFGPTTNRVARLLAIGYGGQSLVSGVTADLLVDSAHEWGTLSDLGSHRLKDLGRPEHVWQLNPEGHPEEFPPLRSLDNPELPNNLPTLLSSFVGRARELKDVRELIADSRLVTLTGSGGSGKTRLAMQTAAELLDGSGEGVWFIELAAINDEDQVPLAVARALHLRDSSDRSPLDALLAALAFQDVLLILDNCEHVINACATFADAVIRNCPSVHVLATSREPLGVDGERVYRVPSMTLPSSDVESVDDLGTSDAVTLFLGRAADSGFVVTDEGAPLVASICQRLDGIPLALELGAARLSSMSLVQLSDRLDQRFRLLTGGNRHAMARHQTLEAMVDWSFGLLTPLEQSVFCRLSVFSGGFELEAAESVASNEEVDQFDVANVIHSLVEKSLVVAEHSGVVLRFRLLETIRHFAAQELLKSGGETEVVEAREQHAAYYALLSEKAGRELIGPGQAHWFRQLDLEMDNLRATLTHFRTDYRKSREVMRVVVNLEEYLIGRGHVEVIPILVEAIESLDDASDDEFIDALLGASNLIVSLLSSNRAQLTVGNEYGLRALALTREHSDREHLAWALRTRTVYALREDSREAVTLIEEALTLAYSNADTLRKARIFNTSASHRISRARGLTHEQRIERIFESLTIVTKLHDAQYMSICRAELALIYTEQSRFADAIAMYEASVAGLASLGASEHLSIARGNLLLGRCVAREFDDVLPLLRTCLREERRTGFRREIGDMIFSAACVASWRGDGERSAQLHGAADALRVDGYASGNLYKNDAEFIAEEESLTRVRGLLGNDFDRVHEVGQLLSRAEACDVALQIQ